MACGSDGNSFRAFSDTDGLLQQRVCHWSTTTDLWHTFIRSMIRSDTFFFPHRLKGGVCFAFSQRGHTEVNAYRFHTFFFLTKSTKIRRQFRESHSDPCAILSLKSLRKYLVSNPLQKDYTAEEAGLPVNHTSNKKELSNSKRQEDLLSGNSWGNTESFCKKCEEKEEIRALGSRCD